MDHGGSWHKTMEQETFDKHRGFNRKESHVSPLAFCNADAVLMREYFPDMTFFNFKTGDIDMLRLWKGVLYRCFPFQLNFATRKKHS